MSGLELNKIAASVLVAGLTAMVIGKVTSLLYHPEDAETRGYSIEVADLPPGAVAPKEKAPVDITLFLADASIEAGQALTRPCATCHSFDEGGPNKVGPNLYHVVGQDIAKVGDYSYSKAMASFEGNWDYQALSEFFTKPKKFMPGTKMAYAGMKKPEDRANLIVYLNSLSPNPLPIPAKPAVEASVIEATEDPATATETIEAPAENMAE